MINCKESIVPRALAICYKPYVKPEEAMIYCNMVSTQLTKKCEEYGIYKNCNGYFKRENLDLIVSGALGYGSILLTLHPLIFSRCYVPLLFLSLLLCFRKCWV